MSVVTDKHVSELQAELSQLKNTWIKPSTHSGIVKQLQDATEAKTTYEVGVVFNLNFLLPNFFNRISYVCVVQCHLINEINSEIQLLLDHNVLCDLLCFW